MSKKEKWTPPPVTTPEAREDQMIILAMDLAEQQLREGVASTPVITHYLKLATQRDKLELEKLKAENAMLLAKKESLASEQRSEQLYAEAIRSFQQYQGVGTDEDEEFDDY